MKAERLRIVAPVPGKSYVGVEVPNTEHMLVRLRPLLESEEFARINSPLAIPLGRGVSGEPVVSDLSTMPHLLIAGTTNSGKSICIAAITMSLVLNNHPDDLKMVMIDPKRVELKRFSGLRSRSRKRASCSAGLTDIQNFATITRCSVSSSSNSLISP